MSGEDLESEIRAAIERAKARVQKEKRLIGLLNKLLKMQLEDNYIPRPPND